ncbi:hypothetical protein PROSTU_01247 [Providencia stuartii ATCC 25827]|uniref:Uncharacterized protein n=1 Tax=Providencia stuartii ATCC 25827 TaxID=471874 RepID=A0AA86YYT9_PROST|nr:hypothetical protein PROSTU_01247 [Providencia stuartii ATCC 25827]
MILYVRYRSVYFYSYKYLNVSINKLFLIATIYLNCYLGGIIVFTQKEMVRLS